MVFIRRVRTKSGATAVQIAEYSSGRQRILEHVGSAHTEGELGILLEQARSLIAPCQDTLDFDVEAQVRVEQLLEPSGDQGELELAQPEATGRDGPGRVETTGSLLLGQVLRGAYQQLGFDVVADQVFRDLVTARIVEPTSKLDAPRVLRDLGLKAPAYATIKRHLDAVIEQDYRSQIARKCFDYSLKTSGLSLLLYDVTTLYFEAENEDDLRKVGFSKERRVDPQIVVGLLVDRAGFPLEIHAFEGNKAECDTRSHVVSGSRRWRT